MLSLNFYNLFWIFPFSFLSFLIFITICNTFHIPFSIQLSNYTVGCIWLQLVKLSTFFVVNLLTEILPRFQNHHTHTLSTLSSYGIWCMRPTVLHRGLRATLECRTPGANPCTAGDRGMCHQASPGRVQLSRGALTRVHHEQPGQARHATPSICVLWPMCVTFP